MNSPIEKGVKKHFERKASKGSAEKRRFKTAYDNFISKIDFKTEAETRREENRKTVEKAFRDFFRDMGWHAAEQSLNVLLEQKSGGKTFRKDGVTPNWYHELRQILPVLSLIRCGDIPIDEMEKHEYGGLETFLCAALLHDSHEDFMLSTHDLFGKIEGKLHNARAKDEITDQQLFEARLKAARAMNIVKILSSKTKRFAEFPPAKDGEEIQLPEGWENTQTQDQSHNIGVENIEYFRGKTNKYYAQTLLRFFSYLLKTTDSIEGLSTRLAPESGKQVEFKGDHHEYARTKRALYGQIGMDIAARKSWGKMWRAIKSLDAQLEVSLNMLEQYNIYTDTAVGFEPRYSAPMRADRAERARRANMHVPDGFNLNLIMLERMEAKARKDASKGNKGLEILLKRSYYPSLRKKGIIRPDDPRANGIIPTNEVSLPGTEEELADPGDRHPQL